MLRRTRAATPILWGAWINSLNGWGGGNGPWDAQTVARFTTDAGKKPGVEHWGQQWGAVDLVALRAVDSRGALSMVDYGIGGTTLQSVADGSQDRVIDSMAAQYAQFGQRVLLRPWWEMNGDWYPWARSPYYISAWRRLYSRVKAVAPLVEFVWCVNTIYNAASDPVTGPTNLYPGDDVVEWVGIDGYNRAGLDGEGWRTPATVFGPTVSRVREIAPSKPIAICETASSEHGGSKAAWIHGLLGNFIPSHPAIELLCWFNWDIVAGSTASDWPIESSASALRAFKTGVASPHYRAGA